MICLGMSGSFDCGFSSNKTIRGKIMSHILKGDIFIFIETQIIPVNNDKISAEESMKMFLFPKQ